MLSGVLGHRGKVPLALSGRCHIRISNGDHEYRRHHRGGRRDAGTDARHRVESTLVSLNARVVEGSMQGREATGRTGRLFSFWRRDVRYCAREIPRRVAPNPTDASCRRAPARPQTRSPRRPSGTRSESSARVLDAGVRGHLHDRIGEARRRAGERGSSSQGCFLISIFYPP